MNKKINVWTAITLCVIVSVITYIFASSTLRNSYNEKIDDAYASLAPFNKLFEIDNYVKKNFVGTVDQENVIKGLLYGYFAGLGDPFSTYHTKEEMEEMNMANNGKLVGIGVLISKEYEHSYSYIRRVMPGSPAENAGLKNGDIITEINGIKLNDENYKQTLDLVPGEIGTKVKLAILRDGTNMNFEVERQSVRSTMVYTDYLEGNIAYIYVAEFSGNVAADFIAAVKEAQQKNVAGYIFDMRNNPGGDLDVICTILDYLLPKGPIVRVKDAKGNIVFTKDSGESCVNAPMTVLTNENTASAAELFTSALRDYHKATIIGTKTFGKGSMQHIVPLNDGSGIRLSVYYYDPPYGDNYNGIGITPDKVIEQNEYYNNHQYLLNESNDVQIKAAKEALNEITENSQSVESKAA